jgi:acyl carrier protein
MQFDGFCRAMFEIIDMEPIEVTENTILKDELEIDSLQMVSLVSGVADRFNIPFENFIVNADKLQTVGGLYSIVKGE